MRFSPDGKLVLLYTFLSNVYFLTEHRQCGVREYTQGTSGLSRKGELWTMARTSLPEL